MPPLDPAPTHDGPTPVDVLSRYVGMIRAVLSKQALPSGSAFDAADVLAQAVAGQSPVAPAAVEGDFTDAGGHRRPFYRPMAQYARALSAWLANEPTGGVDWHGEKMTTWDRAPDTYGLSQPLPAEVAGHTCSVAWLALAEATAARTFDGAPASLVEAVIKRQQPAGHFFLRKEDDNPEPWWYHEFVMLHALASWAAHSGDAAASAAVDRAAAFHHAETQADHATSQPWALHAFLPTLDRVPTGDLLLLGAGVQQPRGLGVVTRFLLADAVVCVEKLRPDVVRHLT